MKIIATWMFIVFILLQGNIKGVIVAYYQANKQFIIEKYCENKAKPSMHCDGKCYLGKKIEAQKKQEEKKQTTISIDEEVNLFLSNSNFNFENTIFLNSSRQEFFYVPKNYCYTSQSIFQPPC